MLKQIFIITLATLTMFVSCKNSNTHSDKEEKLSEVLNYVNPNIGTAHSRWFFYTPGALPFGMAKLGPSTNGSYGNPSGWEAVGYDSRHESIEGFANLHEFQIGGFLFTAMNGDLKTTPGTLENPDEGYRSRFDREDEIASPGYYKVLLKDYNIKAELTATERVGFHRYTFPQSEESYVIFDIGNQLGESGKVKDAYVAFKGDNKIEGWVITYPEYVKKYQSDGEVRMYFSGEIDKKPLEVGTFKGDTVFKNQPNITGVGSGLYLKFKTKADEAINIKAGFSYTSVENAEQNFRHEAANLDFDGAKENAEKIWAEELNKIQVTGSTEDNRIKFYTGLYHALLGRGVANDVNGQFPENDGSVGQIPLDADGNPTFSFYNTDSVWGAFWNLTQLWSLAWPEYYNDFVQSHLAVYKNSGWTADGLANSRYVSGVGTNFVSLVIASAYQAGIKNYDVELAYKAALENEISYLERKEGAGKLDLGQFVNNGYVDYVPGWETTPEGSGFSVSHTLEYSYSSYAVAQFAKALGKMDDYEKLMKLSENWKNLYDDSIDFVRPKLPSGEFIKDFDPFAPWIGFQEGNAWQYTFYVPHQPKELIGKMGEDKFVKRLDSIFTVSEKTKFGGEDIDAFAGLTYLYNHGNQPNLHIAWLFNYTDHPWLTQKWIRRVCDEFYGTGDIHGYGYGQDEDQGQLGSWYVMASMGLFDVKGLTETEPSFQFGSPIFDTIKIKTRNNSEIVINTENNSADNIYIQDISVDGEPYKEKEILLEKLINGAVIDIKLGDKPNNSAFKN